MNALNRRVQGLEEDLEKTEERLLLANQKLDKAATAADDSERMKKVSIFVFTQGCMGSCVSTRDVAMSL